MPARHTFSEAGTGSWKHELATGVLFCVILWFICSGDGDEKCISKRIRFVGFRGIG